MDVVPVVLRIDGFDFLFFSDEGVEPRHIHVRNAGRMAKFWLDPVALAYRGTYHDREIRQIERLVSEHQNELREAWNEFFPRRTSTE
ncbi:MAG TPA: DUF4160 domain-containing protein [Chloroflexota bacterium]|nr:DUF4160 domain-containing protein [Chloroflexota bacterium]